MMDAIYAELSRAGADVKIHEQQLYRLQMMNENEEKRMKGRITDVCKGRRGENTKERRMNKNMSFESMNVLRW